MGGNGEYRRRGPSLEERAVTERPSVFSYIGSGGVPKNWGRNSFPIGEERFIGTQIDVCTLA